MELIFPKSGQMRLRHLLGSKTLKTFARQKSSAINEKFQAEAESNNAAFTEEYERAKPFKDIPGPKGIPLVGMWLDYKRNPWKIHQRHIYIQQLKEEYGDIVKESFSGNTILHLLSPDFTRQVYEAEGKYPYVPPLLQTVEMYRRSHPHETSPGLGFCNGEQWYQLRRVAQQILVRPKKALDYLPLQNEVTREFMSLLPSVIKENGEVDDLGHWVGRWGLETSFNTFLEKRMGFLKPEGHAEADTMINNNDTVFRLSTRLWYSLPFYKLFPTPSFKDLFNREDALFSFNERALKTAVQEYQDQVEGRSDTDKQFLFLSYMLSSKHMTWQDIVSIAISVLNDTLSTTVRAIMFNLYTLAANPDAQEKAHEEAVKILDPSGDLSVQGFNSSPYIKACMKETFRFFPIGLDVQRLAPRDMVIGGYQVPEGTYICLENYVPLQDPEFIPKPDQFIPERWLRENLTEKDKEQAYILIPFSVGTRMCAGRRFAEQEMVLLLASILKSYRLEWPHDEPLDQRYQMLQVPDRAVRVKFVPRNS